MKLQRYFNIGPGVTVKYSSDCKFVPSYMSVSGFSHTQSDITPEPSTKQKKRVDHQLCKLIFCENPLCSDVFESLVKYEAHLLSENHTITAQTSSMDKVRSTYVTQMKASSQLHSVSTNSECTTENLTLTEAMNVCPMMKEISAQGWGLPQRVYFRYSYEQKILL